MQDLDCLEEGILSIANPLVLNPTRNGKGQWGGDGKRSFDPESPNPGTWRPESSCAHLGSALPQTLPKAPGWLLRSGSQGVDSYMTISSVRKRQISLKEHAEFQN